jgi:hypothetical protein
LSRIQAVAGAPDLAGFSLILEEMSGAAAAMPHLSGNPTTAT